MGVRLLKAKNRKAIPSQRDARCNDCWMANVVVFKEIGIWAKGERRWRWIWNWNKQRSGQRPVEAKGGGRRSYSPSSVHLLTCSSAAISLFLFDARPPLYTSIPAVGWRYDDSNAYANHFGTRRHQRRRLPTNRFQEDWHPALTQVILRLLR